MVKACGVSVVFGESPKIFPNRLAIEFKHHAYSLKDDKVTLI